MDPQMDKPTLRAQHHRQNTYYLKLKQVRSTILPQIAQKRNLRI
jgi:hypothetical protein